MRRADLHDTTIVFDLDGTLVDTAPDLIRCTNAMLKRLGLEAVPGAVIRPDISHGARRMLSTALGVRGRMMTPDEIEAIYADYIALYADTIADESRPFPGLEATLDRLASDGARLAVCTNKSEALARKLLAALGLAERFRVITGWDTFQCYKPHPMHLTETIRLSGGDTRRALMVGDSGTDIATARAAGIPVIGVPFGYTATPIAELAPDAIVDHYDQFHATARRLLGG